MCTLGIKYMTFGEIQEIEYRLVSYRRDRSIRDLYEQYIDRTRVVNIVDKRSAFSRTEDDRGSDYDYSRSGCGYHGDDQRGYYGERALYGGERNGPLHRRGDPHSYYRDSAEDPLAVKQAEQRNSGRVTSQTSTRGQRLQPPRSSSMSVCHRGDDCDTRTTDRGEEREAPRRRASHPPVRELSPGKREKPPSPHAHSSRGFSPDGPHPSQPKRSTFPPVSQERERAPSYCLGESQGGSPHISLSSSKDEMPGLKVEQGEEAKIKEDLGQSPEARRAHAIANKAMEIEKLYRQDCETFGMVVKMLVAKQPTLEKQLETALKENLMDLKQRCLEDLRHFISEVDAVLKADRSS